MNQVLQAYRSLPLPLPRFARRYYAPLAAAGMASVVVLQLVVAPMVAPGLAGLLVVSAAATFGLVAALMPMLLRDRRRVQMDHRMHLYITRLGVLSTSNLPRNELLRTLAARTEEGPLADETRRILELVEHWNVSLPQACVIVARNTPSRIFADFLERMAHILETSGDMDGFLRAEQEVVLKEYASVYQGALYAVENLKDMYVSLMMSGVFMVVFALVMPPLTGTDPATLVPAVLLAFLLMEALMVVVLHFRAPPDRLWTDSPIRTAERRDVAHAWPIALALSAFLFAGLWWASDLPRTLVLGLAASPMVLAGIPAARVEGLIKRREANYPAFLRSLGSSVAARGGGAREVLKRLARNDFGPLTPLIRNLHDRLELRLDEVLAWRHFSAETGSRMVNEFNDMFVEAVRAGGRPGAVGDIISDNFLRLDALRRARAQSAGALRGVLLGFTAAMAFTLFIGLQVVGALSALMSKLPKVDAGVPLSFGAKVDIPAIQLGLLGLVAAHAVLGAVMVKRLDGGAWTEGCIPGVAMVWIGVGAAELSSSMLASMFKGAAA